MDRHHNQLGLLSADSDARARPMEEQELIMASDDYVPDDAVTGRPVDFRRIPIMAQFLFTCATQLAHGRRVAFGPSQLAALVQVSTRRVLQILAEQVNVAHRTPPRTGVIFPLCIVEVYGYACRRLVNQLQGQRELPGPRYLNLLPQMPPLPWYAHLDVEQAFGVRGLSGSSIPPFQNLHRQRWDSLRPHPDANDS
jgi:hypothetical protein